MGCDVHLFTEVRKGKKWVSADKWTEEDGRIQADYDQQFYSNRNYDLFAILADVRNGCGFAGCDTGDGFKPIAPCKGIPRDASPQVKAMVKQWEGDGHSHSWFTVAQLLAYDWTQETKQRGVVDALTYYNWTLWAKKHNEGPKSYCGGVGGKDVKHVSVEEMDAKIKEIKTSLGEDGDDPRKVAAKITKEISNYYTKAEWKETYYKAAPDFWASTMPRLLHLGKPENVRIVFFFDN